MLNRVSDPAQTMHYGPGCWPGKATPTVKAGESIQDQPRIQIKDIRKHIPKTHVTPEKGAVWDNQPNNAEEHKRCIFNTRTKILNTMDAK